jgi:hypothetical protein
MSRSRLAAVFLVAVLYLGTALAMADDTREYKFVLGFVNSYDGTSLVINEHWKVNMTDETKVFDSRGRRAHTVRLWNNKWVYVEGPLDKKGEISAEKIYLLPGYVGKKDLRRYPFIQVP